MEGQINWVQLAIEAPLSAFIVLTLYKCYRARVRLKLDSECCKWLFPHLRLNLDYTMRGGGQCAPAPDAPNCIASAPSDESSSSPGTPIEIVTDVTESTPCPSLPSPQAQTRSCL